MGLIFINEQNVSSLSNLPFVILKLFHGHQRHTLIFDNNIIVMQSQVTNSHIGQSPHYTQEQTIFNTPLSPFKFFLGYKIPVSASNRNKSSLFEVKKYFTFPNAPSSASLACTCYKKYTNHLWFSNKRVLFSISTFSIAAGGCNAAFSAIDAS